MSPRRAKPTAERQKKRLATNRVDGRSNYLTMQSIMLVCLLLALVACGIEPTAPAPAPTAAPTRIWLAPGETMRLPVEPQTGPTEEAPTLTFHILVTDELRRTPVTVRRVLLGGKEIAHNVSEFVMQLPGDIADHPLLFQVEADGYEPWGLVLRHRVKYSRHVYWGIALRPKGPSAENNAVTLLPFQCVLMQDETTPSLN